MNVRKWCMYISDKCTQLMHIHTWYIYASDTFTQVMHVRKLWMYISDACTKVMHVRKLWMYASDECTHVMDIDVWVRVCFTHKCLALMQMPNEGIVADEFQSLSVWGTILFPSMFSNYYQKYTRFDIQAFPRKRQVF